MINNSKHFVLANGTSPEKAWESIPARNEENFYKREANVAVCPDTPTLRLILIH